MTTHPEHPSHPDDDLAIDQPEDHRFDEATAGISAWGISIVVHAIALLLLVGVVFLENLRPEQPPLRISNMDAPKPIEDRPDRRDLETKITPELVVDPEVDDQLLSEVDLPVTEIETNSMEEPTVDQAEGQPDAVSASNAGGPGAFLAIGAGGPAAGAFGRPGASGRGHVASGRGGNRASECAVEAALRWFARHQSPNGQWDVDGYPMNCDLGAGKCEPGREHTGADGDIACTGYALLCFLGAGYTHRTLNKYRREVRGGIDWLLAVQDASGLLGRRNYEHPIAAMALIEAYAMTNDPELKDPAQRAVDVILERQTVDDSGYPLGWDYVKPNTRRQDSSVTGWNVMALKSAKVANLDIGDGLTGSKRWLEGAWKAANPDWEAIGPYDESHFPYTWNPTTGETRHDDRVPMGALCAVFLGSRKGEPMLESMIKRIVDEQLPDGYPTNTYYLYYNTLAVFQVGGEAFDRWNVPVRDLLVESQRTDGCFDGSWDWEGTGFHGHGTGRLLSTAYCCLSLEVYYRYLPMAVRGGH